MSRWQVTFDWTQTTIRSAICSTRQQTAIKGANVLALGDCSDGDNAATLPGHGAILPCLKGMPPYPWDCSHQVSQHIICTPLHAASRSTGWRSGTKHAGVDADTTAPAVYLWGLQMPDRSLLSLPAAGPTAADIQLFQPAAGA